MNKMVMFPPDAHWTEQELITKFHQAKTIEDMRSILRQMSVKYPRLTQNGETAEYYIRRANGECLR